MFWLFLIRILVDNLCRKFSLVSVELTIAILFYLWQKSYRFLGNKQQATGNSFNFFIYFLICHNLWADCYIKFINFQSGFLIRFRTKALFRFCILNTFVLIYNTYFFLEDKSRKRNFCSQHELELLFLTIT